ncbi:MAG: glycoside hydrolase family 38 C-terminal domain-containing protein [Microbacterium sp.]
MSSEIVVVPHTHWDREWYEPHDVFRLRLVRMIDALLDLLEQTPDYRFTLDGQAAAIEDYLEMRPESRARVVALVQSGRLAIGPFLILLDEFCCDGETIIRNLEMGIAASEALGGAMPIGYLPDMFGHAAQVPQILGGFGIGHAALWRGVPDRIRTHAFDWRSPDGSVVRCEYLFDSYGNGLDMFAIPGQLNELAPDYVERTRSWFGEDPVLAMLGTDHSAPPADLIDVIDSFDGAGRTSITVATLGEHLQRFEARSSLPVVTGELRSHARGNILPGVFSIRTNLKAEMARSERALDAAERLDLMYGTGENDAFFRTAWHRLIESTAHDSVTGCGVDATAEQVGTRIHTAGHIARGVTDDILRCLARSVSPQRHVVFNPSGARQQVQVDVTLNGAESELVLPGVQLLGALPTVLGDETMSSADLPRLLRRIHGRELFGQQINVSTWGDHALRFDVAEDPHGVWDLAAFTTELEERVAADASGREQWHVETIAAPRQRALLCADAPALGACTVSPQDAVAPEHPVEVSERQLSNGRVQIGVNDDGTVRVTAGDTTLDGVLALVDDGDCGDAYNYGPLDDSSSITRAAHVEIQTLETGPLRGRILVRREYELPIGLDGSGSRSAQTIPLTVDTVVELRADEGFLRVTVDYVNSARDHRLRLLVPVGAADVECSRSAGQYGLTARGRSAEGGWGEHPIPTFPGYRSIAAADAAVLVRKLTEYELVSRAGEQDALALTLSRSVGMMSVNIHPLRDEPAGSEIPVPGAQYLGTTVTTELAILVGASDAETVRAADVFRHEPMSMRGTGGSDGMLPEPRISVAFDGDVVLESARRVAEEAELRVVNYLDEPRALGLRTDGPWQCVDMAGAHPEAVDDAATLSVGPGRILTLRSGTRLDSR